MKKIPIMNSNIRHAIFYSTNSRIKTYKPEERNDVIENYGELKNWDTSGITNMSNLFRDTTFDKESEAIDISRWDTIMYKI